MERKLAALLLLFAFATRCAYADDFGPAGDIRELRFVAPRLLAHRVRQQQTDPKDIRISDVVVVGNAALLSWDARNEFGVMGLMRLGSRWWDALDTGPPCWERTRAFPLPTSGAVGGRSVAAELESLGIPRALTIEAVQHNAALKTRQAQLDAWIRAQRPRLLPKPFRCFDAIYAARTDVDIQPQGGDFSLPRDQTSGFLLEVAYPKNSARKVTSASIYARPPTDAEFMPYPTTANFVSTSVAYFDLTLNGNAPVTFARGTTIDVWFPFVLDDSLQYDLTIGYADKPIGPIYAKPFDNVLHYVLPGFTATPGRSLMAEIDGDWP